MSQEQVLQLLRAKGEMTSKEIGIELGISRNSIVNNLARLLRTNLIQKRQDEKRYIFYYSFKK